METGGLDHHVKVIRPDVMSSQSDKQIAHRALIVVDTREQKESKDGMLKKDNR